MAISLEQIRQELYPGLAAIQGLQRSFALLKEEGAALAFDRWQLATPHIWVPKPAEIVLGAAAAAIIKNPVVTRRFWAGWGK